MRNTIDTTGYRFHTGTAPRGFGMWIMQRTIVNDAEALVTMQTLDYRGMWSDARKAATRQAAPEGFQAGGEWVLLP